MDSVIYKHPVLSRLWIHILLKANHIDKTIYFNDCFVECKRGQLITGRVVLAQELNVNSSCIARALKKLEKLKKVSIQTNSRYSLITVIKYNTYQLATDESEQPNGQQVNSQRTASEQPVNTNKKYKNEKKGENEKNKIKNTVAENHGNGIEIPENLNNPSFQSAWSDWNQYRREIRKPLKPMSMKQQLKFLAEQPDPVACINQSITNQWQGLFEIKHLNNGNGHYKPEQHARQRVLDNVRAVEELIANVSKRN